MSFFAYKFVKYVQKIARETIEEARGGIHMEKEIVIKENNLIRIYSVEEKEKYFNNKKYIYIEDLININLMQFLMQHERKSIKNEENKIKVLKNKLLKDA